MHFIVVLDPIENGQYQAWLGDRLICTSASPLVQAAQILIGEGVSPKERLWLMHRSQGQVWFGATIEEWAGYAS